jgi:Putative bacterial sensory transduction regulator
MSDGETFLKQISNIVALAIEQSSPYEAQSDRLDQASALYYEVAQFLEQNQWLLQPVPQHTIFSTNFQGQHGSFNCYAETIEPKKQFVFYSICPFKIPEGKRSAIAEWIARANWQLVMGNFDLNFDEGSLRYRSSIELAGDRFNTALSELIKRVAYTNVMIMDQQLPAIMAIVQGNIAAIEVMM